MSIAEERLGDILLLRLINRLDSSNSSDLEVVLLERVATHRVVLVDFTQLDFISSAGLRVMLMAAKRAKQVDHPFALYGLSDNIHKVFAVSGFLKILQVFPTQEEALVFVGGAA